MKTTIKAIMNDPQAAPFRFQASSSIPVVGMCNRSQYRRWDLNPHPLYGDRILSPARLPSVWYWADVGMTLISGIFQGSTIAPVVDRIVAALGWHGQHVQKNCRTRCTAC